MNYRTEKKTFSALMLGLSLLATGCVVTRSTPHKPVAVHTQFSNNDSSATSQELNKQLLFEDKNLVALIDSAVRKNPDVLAAAHRIEVARAYWRYRRGAMLPTLGVEASGGVQKYGDYTMEGVGNFDTNLSPNISENQKIGQPHVPYYFLGLRSNWEIDLWGKLKQQKKAAYHRILASEQGRRLVITSLVADIASRYYELQALDAELDVIEQNIRLQDSALSIAQIQKEVGRTTELGVQQFQAQLLRTKSLYEQIKQQIVQTENEINYLAGRLPQHVARSKNLMDGTLPEVHLAGLPQQILNYRPDVKQAELELEANHADVTAAKAALLPALTISPFAGYSSFNTATLFNPASIAYGIIGGLTGPLLNRSEMKANISRTEAEKQIAYQDYFRSVINAFNEVETTLSDLRFLKNIYELNRQEASVLSNAISTSKELYKVGYATYLEVITAQGNAIEAQINAIETKKNIHLALIALYRSTGGGW
ncbi:MAG TPA: TolC family protein [Flavipsychrobacter sp.]|nr:TolC family protein [Flavipsychrobacter sp.]